MNCKHVEVRGHTTKHWHCRVKNEAVDDYKCKDCPLYIPKNDNVPDFVNKLFRGFKGHSL